MFKYLYMNIYLYIYIYIQMGIQAGAHRPRPRGSGVLPWARLGTQRARGPDTLFCPAQDQTGSGKNTGLIAFTVISYGKS